MPTRDLPYTELWYEKLRSASTGDPVDSTTAVLGLTGAEASTLPAVVGVSATNSIRSVIVTWSAVGSATVFYEVQVSPSSDMSGASTFLLGGNRFEYMEVTQDVTYYVRVRARLGTLIGPFSAIVSSAPDKTQTIDIELEAVNVIAFSSDPTVFDVPANDPTFTDFTEVTFTGRDSVVNLTYTVGASFSASEGGFSATAPTSGNAQYCFCEIEVSVHNDTDNVTISTITSQPATIGWYLFMTGWTGHAFVFTTTDNPVTFFSFPTEEGKQYTVLARGRNVSVHNGSSTLATILFRVVQRDLLLQEVKR